MYGLLCQNQLHLAIYCSHVTVGNHCADIVTKDNLGGPVLAVMQRLQTNKTMAHNIGQEGRHLVVEVLHPDNLARSFPPSPLLHLW